MLVCYGPFYRAVFVRCVSYIFVSQIKCCDIIRHVNVTYINIYICRICIPYNNDGNKFLILSLGPIHVVQR